jgi:hypothetical protein
MTGTSTVPARGAKTPITTTWSRTVTALVVGGAVVLAIGSLLP